MTNPIKREVVIGNCRADGCRAGSYCKGYCESHYRRYRKYGDPLAGKTPSREPERFLRQIVETDACIDWPYQVNENGYGQIRFAGKMMNAHRASLIIHSGPPICPEMHAAHEPQVCHNRRCVNPRHLRWATPKENMEDRVVDGTVYRPAGELHGASKLTAASVAEMRASSLPQKDLAARFGISKQQVSKIIRRERWPHV